MLLLMFRVAEDLYAVAAERVVEVVPRVELRPIPHAPSSLAGLFNYRGKAIPVFDLGLLLGSAPCIDRLDTRLVLVGVHDDVEQPGDPRDRLIGLVAECVSDVATARDDQVVLPAMNMAEAPYLGPVVRTDQGLIQVISVERILPESLRDALFGQTAEVP